MSGAQPSLEVVEVGGSAVERGRAFGAARSKPIAAWTSAWLASLSAGGVDNPLAYVRSFLQETDFASAVEHHVPDLRAEIEAIAAASGMEPEIAFAAQCMDEEWAYRQERLGAPVQHKCSSAAVHAQGQTYIGQNMDLGSWTDGHQVVLMMQPHGRDPGACVSPWAR
jgi:isopenicillin-N N-acyltransferase like protein